MGSFSVFILGVTAGFFLACGPASSTLPPAAQRVTPTTASLIAPSGAEPLLILAASDLQLAMAEIASQYEAETGRRVTVTFGSTGNFTQQIENGAPADLFFAANESFVADLEKKGFVLEGTRQLYATGRIVVTPARNSTVEVKTLQDLLQPEVRNVAIANPEHAPYGLAAKQALQTAGLWERVQPKLVLGENISHTFQLVRTGNAEAGIVALSVALGVPGAPYTLVDEALHTPLRQAAAVLVKSKQPDLAREFLAFVSGASGRPIMKKFGFVLPGEA